MMPSLPLPAITLSNLTSYSPCQHVAQIEPAVGVEIQSRKNRASSPRLPWAMAPSGFSFDASLATWLRPYCSARAMFRSCAPLRKAAAILCREGRVAPTPFYTRPHFKVLYSSSRAFAVQPTAWHVQAEIREQKTHSFNPLFRAATHLAILLQ